MPRCGARPVSARSRLEQVESDLGQRSRRVEQLEGEVEELTGLVEQATARENRDEALLARARRAMEIGLGLLQEQARPLGEDATDD